MHVAGSYNHRWFSPPSWKELSDSDSDSESSNDDGNSRAPVDIETWLKELFWRFRLQRNGNEEEVMETISNQQILVAY